MNAQWIDTPYDECPECGGDPHRAGFDEDDCPLDSLALWEQAFTEAGGDAAEASRVIARLAPNV